MSQSDKHKVAIARTSGDVLDVVRQAVELAGGLPDVKGKKVAVKPNLMGPALSVSGTITDARATALQDRLHLGPLATHRTGSPPAEPP